MKRIVMDNVCKIIFTVFAILLTICCISTTQVRADSSAILTMDPTGIEPDQLSYIEDVGVLFNVTIMVVDVEDLYTWQVMLYYNASIINCTKGFYPADHVFAGKFHFPMEPIINNTGGYVLHGSTLMGEDPGFNGTGKLCTFTFNSISIGDSGLIFSKPYGEDTFLQAFYHSPDEFLPAEPVDGTITIIPEFTTPLVFLIVLALSTVAMLVRKRLQH